MGIMEKLRGELMQDKKEGDGWKERGIGRTRLG